MTFQSNTMRWARDWHTPNDWILVDRTDRILARVVPTIKLGVEQYHWAVTTTWPQLDGYAATVELAKEQSMEVVLGRRAA